MSQKTCREKVSHIKKRFNSARRCNSYKLSTVNHKLLRWMKQEQTEIKVRSTVFLESSTLYTQ